MHPHVAQATVEIIAQKNSRIIFHRAHYVSSRSEKRCSIFTPANTFAFRPHSIRNTRHPLSVPLSPFSTPVLHPFAPPALPTNYFYLYLGDCPSGIRVRLARKRVREDGCYAGPNFLDSSKFLLESLYSLEFSLFVSKIEAIRIVCLRTNIVPKKKEKKIH